MSHLHDFQISEIELLRRERDYYKRQADELAGEAVKRDYTISTLRHALQQKQQGFALLAELQQYIGTEQKLRDILEHTVQRVNATLGMDRSAVLTRDEQTGHFKADARIGFDTPISDHFPSLQIELPAEWLESDEALLVNKATPATGLIERVQTAFALPHFILLPVKVSGDTIGLILTGRQREQRPFAPPLDSGDVDTLQAIATLIEAFVHNRQLAALREDNEMLRYLATVDKLTGIANRRRFEEVLRQEWARAQRRGTPLSLFILDVDHFKKCNDTYGHNAGDAILKQVAQRLTLGLRPGDMGARYGGEEFAVVLPDTNEKGAMAVAERIRAAIAATPISHQANGECSSVTASIGVATMVPRDEVEPSGLVSTADKALYRAKRQGRNCVVSTVCN